MLCCLKTTPKFCCLNSFNSLTPLTPEETPEKTPLIKYSLKTVVLTPLTP